MCKLRSERAVSVCDFGNKLERQILSKYYQSEPSICARMNSLKLLLPFYVHINSTSMSEYIRHTSAQREL